MTRQEAAAKLRRTTFTFQRAALDLSEATDAELEGAAAVYMRRWDQHQRAVAQAKEAFADVVEEPPAE